MTAPRSTAPRSTGPHSTAPQSPATSPASTTQPAGDAAPVRHGWWRRNWKRLAVAVVLLAVVAAGSGYYIVFGRMMLSEPFKRAWDIVTHDQKVVAELGEPIGGGWFPHGNVNNDTNIPEASMNFSISGPKGKAEVAALGRRIDGALGVSAVRRRGQRQRGRETYRRGGRSALRRAAIQRTAAEPKRSQDRKGDAGPGHQDRAARPMCRPASSAESPPVAEFVRIPRCRPGAGNRILTNSATSRD